MAHMLEILEWEFKITMINRLRVLTERVDSIQEQMVYISGGMEILRIKKKH